MLVTDELKRRKRAVGLMFFDFVEALARLADFISPPSMEQLLATNSRGSDDCGGATSPSAAHACLLDCKGGNNVKEGGHVSLLIDRAGSTAVVKDGEGAEHPLVDYLKLKGWLEVVGGGWRWLEAGGIRPSAWTPMFACSPLLLCR